MENIFSSIDELKQLLLEMELEDTVVLESPSYLSAVVGVSETGQLIYDYARMISTLMEEEGLAQEDAREFIDFNTIEAIPYMGLKHPIILFPLP